jgi:hypothetical protein
MHDPENPFGELNDLSGIKKAEQMSSSGRIPPGVYKGVCVAVDLEGDGKLVDRKYFETESKTKAVKIFIEILDPEKVGDETTKGRVHEHVFWCTEKNRPYVMRDAETILGMALTKLDQLLSSTWAGKTLEFGVKDEPYNGFIQSKVTFINAWTPDAQGKGESKEKDKKASSKDETKKAESPKKGQTAQAGTSKKGAGVDF